MDPSGTCKMKRLVGFALCLALIVAWGSQCALASDHTGARVRLPAVAGMFYPAGPKQLRHMVLALQKDARGVDMPGKILGLVSPHAGYIYSGAVAATAYARRVPQDPESLIFNAQVWRPDSPYRWRCRNFQRPAEASLIYEVHIGMAQEEGKIGSYQEFAAKILPRVKASGYNTLQIMAIPEHPYYGSFGYQVSNFFAASSRFGTPEDLKALIDRAHSAGLAVIIDLIHSHAVSNEVEGLSRFDGTLYQYFHDGSRGRHELWDSRCFDYGKYQVLHFLLSNCRFWLDEYKVDGFRFDGVTSMLYLHHGLSKAFTSYDDYFDASVDEESLTYLALALEGLADLEAAAAAYESAR